MKTEKIEPIDLEKHKGEWLALEPGTYRVVGHHKDFNQAKNQGLKKSIKKPVMFPVPETGIMRGMVL